MDNLPLHQLTMTVDEIGTLLYQQADAITSFDTAKERKRRFNAVAAALRQFLPAKASLSTIATGCDARGTALLSLTYVLP